MKKESIEIKNEEIIKMAKDSLPKLYKSFPMFEGLLKYFPNALREISHLSLVANEQHNPGEPLHWAREKSFDHKDALLRHLTEIAKGNEIDDDDILHATKVAWRALANLEETLRKK